MTLRADFQITEITLAVKDSYAPYIDTKPLHGSQKKYSQSEQERLHVVFSGFKGYTFYGLELIPNREFYNLIYKYGDDIILISPADIRGKMASELERSLILLKSIRQE